MSRSRRDLASFSQHAVGDFHGPYCLGEMLHLGVELRRLAHVERRVKPNCPLHRDAAWAGQMGAEAVGKLRQQEAPVDDRLAKAMTPGEVVVGMDEAVVSGQVGEGRHLLGRNLKLEITDPGTHLHAIAS